MNAYYGKVQSPHFAILLTILGHIDDKKLIAEIPFDVCCDVHRRIKGLIRKEGCNTIWYILNVNKDFGTWKVKISIKDFCFTTKKILIQRKSGPVYSTFSEFEVSKIKKCQKLGSLTKATR